MSRTQASLQGWSLALRAHAEVRAALETMHRLWELIQLLGNSVPSPGGWRGWRQRHVAAARWRAGVGQPTVGA